MIICKKNGRIPGRAGLIIMISSSSSIVIIVDMTLIIIIVIIIIIIISSSISIIMDWAYIPGRAGAYSTNVIQLARLYYQ